MKAKKTRKLFTGTLITIILIVLYIGIVDRALDVRGIAGAPQIAGDSQIPGYSSPFTDGATGWSQLGYNDDNWYTWYGDFVGDVFCTMVIFGDMDCWTSTICAIFYTADLDPEEGDGGDAGTVFSIDPTTGQIVTVAHIEGERSPALIRPTNGGTETYYTYKVSFFVSDIDDPEDTDLFVTIELKGAASYTVGTLHIENGASAGLTGASIKIFDSTTYYDKIKMSFDPPVQTWYEGFLDYGSHGAGTFNVDSIEVGIQQIGTVPETMITAGAATDGDGPATDPTRVLNFEES